MRLLAVIVVLAAGCTPLRPLDEPADTGAGRRDTGGLVDASQLDAGPAPDVSVDAAVPAIDVRALDAPIPPGTDAAGPDARAADAWTADAWAADARAPDASLPVRPSRAGELVISELMIEPNGGDDQQWMELYNPSDTQTYELSGCSLDGMTTTFIIGPSVRVPPRTYFTLAAADTTGFAPDFVYGRGTFGFVRDRDRAALVCEGVLIDEVVYDLRFPVEPDASMMVLPATLMGPSAHLANDLSSAWCFADGSLTYSRGNAGTPGEPNLCR